MGPRQPWHDLHCKIEGPAAYDVLINFEQRWRKASKWSQLGKRVQRIAHWKDDALLKIGRISWFLSPTPSIPNDDPKLWVREENDPENWNVQVKLYYWLCMDGVYNLTEVEKVVFIFKL